MGKVTFTGDSVAAFHAVTKEAAQAFELKETAMSKAGIGFTAAHGSKIVELGQRHIKGVTDDSKGFRMNCHVTDVKKNLASFPKMVEEGINVFLSKTGSYFQAHQDTRFI